MSDLTAKAFADCLTAKAFADWLHPTDVIEWYHQQRDNDPTGRVVTMLRDGLLQAAAGQLIIDGHDLGLALVPRELWEIAIHPGLWTTGRFRIQRDGQIISAHDVRIDRDIQILPAVADTAPPRPLEREDISLLHILS